MIGIQDISDEALVRVINEGGDVKWNFYALKVMISRLKLKLQLAEDKEIIRQCCLEMRDLLNRSKSIPNANKDVKIILERFIQNTEKSDEE